MIFVLRIINNVNNICKNENHWSLLITRYSLLGIQTPIFHLHVLLPSFFFVVISLLKTSASTLKEISFEGNFL